MKEVSPGRIINTVSGEDFTYSDSCVERGVTIGYNANATAAAKDAVRKLMTQWLLN